MDLSQIPIGKEPPKDVYVIVEIPQGGVPVKYEMNKQAGALFVDRFLHTAMYYPGNYGFIPHTLAEDGDPIDAIIVTQAALVPGCVVRCRPVGVLRMDDEAGPDEKLLMVPVDKLHPFYSGIRTHEDLPLILRDQIAHFFQHYKDLETGKLVKNIRWEGPDSAEVLILEAMTRESAARDARLRG